MGSDIHGPTHDHVAELLGAYALDAVPDDERRIVEEHLAECRVCRAEVQEHRDTAAMLAAGAPAPERVWDRIADAIKPGEPAPLEEERRVRAARSRGPKGIGRWIAAAAAAAAMVAIGVLGLKVVEQDRVLDRLVASTQDDELVRAANEALLDPRASRLTLASEDRAVLVEVVVLPNGTGYLVRNNLRPLPPGRTYQLWALDEGIPVSIGVLGRDPGVVAFSADPGLAGLAITEERSGGVVSTKNDPLVVGQAEVA